MHKDIVQAMREYSESRVRELLTNDEDSTVRELLLRAACLTRALGAASTPRSCMDVMSDVKSTRALAGDRITLDILKRLTVMRKLAETHPQFVHALGLRVGQDRPRLRSLVRESPALTRVHEDMLKSSFDVPFSLLCGNNSLAMEDFMIRKGHRPSATFMILKQGLQAVVPREAAKSVLQGKVAYTVLDEVGVRHFEPLDVFSALRLRPASTRFSMYRCPVAKEYDFPDYPDLASSYLNGGAASASTASSGQPPDNSASTLTELPQDRQQTSECNGLDLSRSDRTLEYRTPSRENTPSFRKISSLCQDAPGEGVKNLSSFLETLR